MSMLEIRTGALRNKAEQLEGLRQKDMETLKRIRILVYGLEEVWKGHSANQYLEKYREKEPDLSEFYNTMEDLINVLRSTADEADDLDSRLYRLVSRI